METLLLKTNAALRAAITNAHFSSTLKTANRKVELAMNERQMLSAKQELQQAKSKIEASAEFIADRIRFKAEDHLASLGLSFSDLKNPDAFLQSVATKVKEELFTRATEALNNDPVLGAEIASSWTPDNNE